jgi:hypothetical protein
MVFNHINTARGDCFSFFEHYFSVSWAVVWDLREGKRHSRKKSGVDFLEGT